MRLSHPGTSPAGAAIAIEFNGRRIDALEGETVGANPSASGIAAFRRTARGAPRGLHCGMGACQDCVVTIDGGIGQRACIATVRAGMVVRSELPANIPPVSASLPKERSPEERSPEILV